MNIPFLLAICGPSERVWLIPGEILKAEQERACDSKGREMAVKQGSMVQTSQGREVRTVNINLLRRKTFPGYERDSSEEAHL